MWLVVPAILIGATQRFPVLGLFGAILLAVIVPFLPFLQVRYAVEGRVSALFSRRAIRDRFRRAPWAFAFSLFVLLVAAIPLYFLKIEMIPREAAWLPTLVFVVFLAPARLLTGWAYASGHRDTPRHWVFSDPGRLYHHRGCIVVRRGRLHRPIHVMGRHFTASTNNTPSCSPSHFSTCDSIGKCVRAPNRQFGVTSSSQLARDAVFVCPAIDWA